MKITILKTLIVAFAYIASILTAFLFGMLYDLFPSTHLSGGFIGSREAVWWLVGYPLSVIFLLTFLIHVQGARYKWHWNVLALAPAIIFEVGFDPLHIYVPLLLAFIAWGFGMLANRALTKLAPSFMSKISG